VNSLFQDDSVFDLAILGQETFHRLGNSEKQKEEQKKKKKS